MHIYSNIQKHTHFIGCKSREVNPYIHMYICIYMYIYIHEYNEIINDIVIYMHRHTYIPILLAARAEK
jgi:hypothetical protein